MLLALRKLDFPRKAEDIYTRWFELLSQEQVQYYASRTQKASTLLMQCK